MNRHVNSVLADLGEEAACTRNDLEVLHRIAYFLDEMRGNNVPRDLFIRVRGGSQYTPPWQVDVYAEEQSVHDHHRDDLDGYRGEMFILSPVLDPWAKDEVSAPVS